MYYGKRTLKRRVYDNIARMSKYIFYIVGYQNVTVYFRYTRDTPKKIQPAPVQNDTLKRRGEFVGFAKQ